MELWTLRILHITTSILWVGMSACVAFYVFPAINAAGAAGGAVMKGILERRFPMLMNALAIVVVLTGARLYMVNFSMDWLATGTGILLTAGGTLGLVSAIIALAVQRPLAARLGAMANKIASSGAPPTEAEANEMTRLRTRLANAARHNAFSMLIAAVCMSAARLAPF